MMRQIIDTLNFGQRTVVMTTHNLERGLELADRVAILHRGEIVYQSLRKDIDSGGFQETYRRCTS